MYINYVIIYVSDYIKTKYIYMLRKQQDFSFLEYTFYLGQL